MAPDECCHPHFVGSDAGSLQRMVNHIARTASQRRPVEVYMLTRCSGNNHQRRVDRTIADAWVSPARMEITVATIPHRIFEDLQAFVGCWP
jgi:hypothetical protein